ncbi:MAG: hypothetical protein U0Z75_04210 [Deinococcaceae bacterium]
MSIYGSPIPDPWIPLKRLVAMAILFGVVFTGLGFALLNWGVWLPILLFVAFALGLVTGIQLRAYSKNSRHRTHPGQNPRQNPSAPLEEQTQTTAPFASEDKKWQPKPAETPAISDSATTDISQTVTTERKKWQPKPAETPAISDSATTDISQTVTTERKKWQPKRKS